MANTDFSKTRNDFQQYDLVTVFKASETRIMRHLHVATMAVVTKIDGDTIQCMPFPIRENTTANTIYAFNIGNVDYEVGDKVLVIFTDRDFRKNYASATTSERSIGKTNDAQLHSIDYGVVMPMTKAYEGSLEALKEKIDKHINDYTNPHNITKEQVGLGNVVNQGMDLNWTRYLVLSESGSSIADQTVKSFTATEIDHGDKFNGDLSSTTCSSAPMMVTTGKLTASSANEPNATKTAKTRDIRIGGTTKTITCSMNPFMEYFFDHGYHFDTESTSSSYECDAGFVVYEETLYYCVFSYKDSANNGFVTYPVSLENNVARLQSTPIAVSNSKSGISFSYDEIKAVGSLYECLGADKDKAYNVYLVLDSRPPIPLTFNDKAKDFLTADGDSCLDFPSMKGVIYETY